jgi:hypothetical protein
MKFNAMLKKGRERGGGHYAYQPGILFTYFRAQTKKTAKIVADRCRIFLCCRIAPRDNIVFETTVRFIPQFPSRNVAQSPQPSNNLLKNELR